MVPPRGVSGQVDRTCRSHGRPTALPDPGMLPLGEAGDAAARIVPALGHPADPARRARSRQQGQQLTAARRGALGDNLHPAVLKVLRRAHQAEFQRPGTDPPPEADTLNLPGDPYGEPGGRIAVTGGIPAAGHRLASWAAAAQPGHWSLPAGHVIDAHVTTGPVAAEAGISGSCRT